MFCRKSFLPRKVDLLWENVGKALVGYFCSGDAAEKTDKTSIADRCANQMQESTQRELVGLQRLLKAQLQVDISTDGAPDPSKGVERPRISQEQMIADKKLHINMLILSLE